ncbi:MAG: phosphoribosylglycinamide synthetase C domain-containing protein [Candidatus Moranbacteria bacterium]|nr:phosphoribosylglycinamide synthetase C domain-containing protein [Candidatus Moranbacteria bacterium]MDZ4384806.1 phosphoribosylglycinamide synthetase C domain-containing protein [Candidatus Moranbacteria bacterium]
MNVLLISKDFSGADLAYRLQKEGNQVKIFIEEAEYAHAYDGMLEKIADWKAELDWVGRDGLIVFDCVGFGQVQDDLRAEGYSVIGGSAMGDRLEHDRQYGQKILSLSEVNIIPSTNFGSVEEVIGFVQKNEGPWVVKQNGHIDKTFNYVGRLKSGRDVVSMLRNYNENNREECASIDLQKKVKGVEVGVGRYFNGLDWAGPIEINFEHKGLFNGNLGPKTFEMGTLMWYDDNEDNRLFKEILDKLKPALIKGNFRGDVDVNCIINEEGAHPLELTARFGFPALQLQDELHRSPWGEFLKAVADGQPYDLKYKKEYGIVALVAVPPFPYEVNVQKYSSQGLEINFKETFNAEDFQHIHFEEVSRKKEDGQDIYYISGKTGFVLHVTGSGKTIEEARDKTYDLINQIVIPKMFYRSDIGMKFVKKDRDFLKKLGWL